MVGSSVGRSCPTPIYVTHTPHHTSGPSYVIADQAPQDHHAVLPPIGPPKEPSSEMTPKPSIGRKRKPVEDVAGPIHKIGPVTSDLVYQDRLGKLVASLSEKLSTALLWEDFVKNHRGRSYLAPAIDNIQHSARGLLQNFRDHGISVPMDDPPWTLDAISHIRFHIYHGTVGKISGLILGYFFN